MINIKEKEQCCGCSACYNICPQNAIIMEEDKKGFKYPKVNIEKCINCKLCEKVCPIINNKEGVNKTKAYASINKDDEIRKESSSGGIFTLLAEEVIEMDGVVFGAAFDENFNVIHKCIKNKNEIGELRGSKYVQSDIGESYKQAKIFLEQNKYVLFTGTPCQIEGLKNFLGKNYDKLYTQDFICHGVPSKKIWKKYLSFMQKDKEKLIKTINFRNKKHGWENYSMNIEYNNKKIYNKEHNKDIYMRAFLQNISLRESCYNCQFKKYNRNSDITLADFWGISKVKPEINDHKGTSLVIINSNKGKFLFEKIRNRCIIKEVDLEEAIRYNKAFAFSAKYNENSEKFFEDVDDGISFDKAIKKYTIKPTLMRKIINKCKDNMRKLVYK